MSIREIGSMLYVLAIRRPHAERMNFTVLMCLKTALAARFRAPPAKVPVRDCLVRGRAWLFNRLLQYAWSFRMDDIQERLRVGLRIAVHKASCRTH
jgi:hypothetical protein